MKLSRNKYFLPLNNIPFKDIPSLEEFEYNYVQCEEVRIDNLFIEGASVITVFYAFHKEKNSIYSESKHILFGPVLSQHLSTRGKVKCVLKDKSLSYPPFFGQGIRFVKLQF